MQQGDRNLERCATCGRSQLEETRKMGVRVLYAPLAVLVAMPLLPIPAAAEEVTAFKASGAADALGALELGVLALGLAVRNALGAD